MLEQPDEQNERLEEPVYGAYRYVREILGPGLRVLDVGCGNAKVSAYLAESGAIVHGIEPAGNRASVASNRLSYLSVLDPTQADDPGLLDAYDVITYFDVLEHVVDPRALLHWSVKRLAPGGSIVASIPNSAHYSFRVKVGRGDWSLSDHGLFDRTHVRFFDTRTVTELRPEGTAEVDRRYFAPGRGMPQRLVHARPNLFALHTVLRWQRAGAAVR